VSADRFVTFQFCDDIRQELGNKYSLIGCYSTTIHVNPIPSVLPKLCAVIQVYTNIDRPFSRLTVRIVRDDKAIGEITFPDTALDMSQVDSPDGARRHTIVAMIAMTPFPVEAPCTLRVEAETEEGTLHGGSVWIRPSTQPIAPGTP
jgi:hypothetical protein